MVSMNVKEEFCPFNIIGTCTICWSGRPAVMNSETEGPGARWCMAWDHIELHCKLISPTVGVHTLEDGDRVIPLIISKID